jgi:hypothetical protein
MILKPKIDDRDEIIKMNAKIKSVFFMGFEVDSILDITKELELNRIYTVGTKNNFKLVDASLFIDNSINFKHNDVKAGIYEDITEYPPIDSDLLNQMAFCEQLFLGMADRLFIGIGYRRRYRMYMDHLRYWRGFFNDNKIDLILMAGVPHEGFDFIIYCLARDIFSIPILGTYVLPFRPKKVNLGYIYSNLFSHAKKTVPNSDFNSYDLANLGKFKPYAEEFWLDSSYIPFTRANSVSIIKIINKRLNRLSEKIKKSYDDKRLIAKIYSRILFQNQDRIQREKSVYFESEKRINKFYNSNSVSVDKISNINFIYFPLHYQPEASTSPLGIYYASQELVCELISSTMPENTFLVVKEHPRASKSPNVRNIDFYKRILNCRNTFLLDKSANPKELISLSMATATITGTSAIESIFFLKPVLMFGTRIFENAPGVYKITNTMSLRDAIKKIFFTKNSLSKLEVIKYLSNLDQYVFNYVSNEEDASNSNGLNVKQSSKNLSKAMLENIKLINF